MKLSAGYSLWLVPLRECEAHSTFSRCISEIAEECGTYTFVPHVTLLYVGDGAEEEMCGKTQELANALVPPVIQLGAIESNGTYHQILFSQVEKSDAVMRAHALAQKIFGVDRGTYFPHLSLAYGDISSEKIAALTNRLTNRDLISGMTFTAGEIELWRCEGTVEEWEKVAAFPLLS